MIADKAIPRIGPTERIFSRPSWADPEFLMLSSAAESFIYIVQGLPVEQIVPADPKRWAVGFTLPSTVIAVPKVSPIGDPAEWGENVQGGIRGTWFTIFNYGPLVCQQWYINGTAPQQIRVWTLEIQ